MKSTGWLMSLVLLVGCGVLRVQDKPSVNQLTQSKYRFDYTLSNAEPISLNALTCWNCWTTVSVLDLRSLPVNCRWTIGMSTSAIRRSPMRSSIGWCRVPIKFTWKVKNQCVNAPPARRPRQNPPTWYRHHERRVHTCDG